MLGTSVGKVSGNGYSAIDKTSFGADTSDKSSFFTGRPYVEDSGYAFLFRNYRADTIKWLIRDPLGYPNVWNNLLYVNNAPTFEDYIPNMHQTAEIQDAWVDAMNNLGYTDKL